MVKKPKIDEEEFEGLEDDELDEEELEELEKSEKRKIVPKKKVVKKKPEPKRRFTVFTQAPRIGIMDAETGEIMGEGETATLEVLANILERLERIETNLGSMMEQ